MPAPVVLSGLRVAVTGGGHGIGRAIGARFARAGARVALGDLDIAAAEAVAATAGERVIALSLDVSDRESFAAFLDAAEREHGPLDVLVNNAGIEWVGPFHNEPDAVSRRELEVNLLGTIHGARLAVKRMLPRGAGHIVNVASGVGRVPLPGSAVYAASKHGIVGLTESLRLEYRESGLRFSLIQPARVQTAMLDGLARPRPLAIVTPEAVAAAVVGAVRENRFEVWVPVSQGATAKLSALLPRQAREAMLRAFGVTRLARDANLPARRSYHQRTFGQS